MAYRIGSQCFSSKEAATDYQMSTVAPVITQDGKLLHPVKNGETWTFAGQPVNLSFGDCDPVAEFKDGAAVAAAIVGLMVTAYCIRYFIAFIHKAANAEGEA